MKFRTLRNWENPARDEGLVFFAQLMEELLNEYSLDTYKPSAMNSASLCDEAADLIRLIEEEIIDRSALNCVIDELLFNLKKDAVAKSLLAVDLDLLSKRVSDPAASVRELSVTIDIIRSQISADIYKKRTEELLLDAVSNPGGKNLIRSLTRTYATTLINSGYSVRFLYPTVRGYFHWGRKVEGCSFLKGFFDIVSAPPQEYTAVLKVNPIFEEISDSCKVFDVSVCRELPVEVDSLLDEKNFKGGENQVYLVIEKIIAMDVFSARDRAEVIVENIGTLASLFHHGEAVEWGESVFLTNIGLKKSRVVTSSKNPMLLCADLRRDNAAVKLNAFINSFSLRAESVKKFIRAAQLHSLALRSDSAENQLLNLWVAIETIVPSALSKNKTKIGAIIESILPFLSLRYIESISERLLNDFLTWKRSAFLAAVNGIDAECDRHRLIKLLLLEDHNKEREELFEELRNFYLLRNRAFYFSETVSSTKKIAGLLEGHWTRVDWQIRRIYRTRNMIVHAGRTPPYTEILIQNLHDYLDIVLDSIGRLACEGSRINSIESAFVFGDMKYREFISGLRAQDKPIDSQNIERFLLHQQL